MKTCGFTGQKIIPKDKIEYVRCKNRLLLFLMDIPVAKHHRQ